MCGSLVKKTMSADVQRTLQSNLGTEFLALIYLDNVWKLYYC